MASSGSSSRASAALSGEALAGFITSSGQTISSDTTPDGILTTLTDNGFSRQAGNESQVLNRTNLTNELYDIQQRTHGRGANEATSANVGTYGAIRPRRPNSRDSRGMGEDNEPARHRTQRRSCSMSPENTGNPVSANRTTRSLSRTAGESKGHGKGANTSSIVATREITAVRVISYENADDIHEVKPLDITAFEEDDDDEIFYTDLGSPTSENRQSQSPAEMEYQEASLESRGKSREQTVGRMSRSTKSIKSTPHRENG